MQSVIWRNFELAMPGSWEMLAFGTNPRAGRCTFADRCQHRLQFCWDIVPGAPDFDRMVGAYLAELKRKNLAEDIVPAAIGAWHGFSARAADRPLSHFSRYFPGERRLVQLVFLWPEARDLELESAVLDAARPAPADAQGFRRWRAFGLDMRVSDGLELSRNMAQCANTRFTFNNPRAAGGEEHFERRGMVAEWLGAPVKDWLCRRTLDAARILRKSSEQIGGHTIENIGGDRRAGGIAGLAGKRRNYRAAAWICPADGRLYFCAAIGGEADAGALAGRRLACCDALRSVR